MGKECVRKAFGLLESSDWTVEKVTAKGDTIQSAQRDKLGKVFRLTVCNLEQPKKIKNKNNFFLL